MINLLPPTFKQEVKYSHRNAALLHYLIIVAVVFVVVAGSLVGARHLLNQRITETDKRIAEKQLEITNYKTLEGDASKITARLNSIQAVQKSQARFSVLLSDLAEYLPAGTAITSMTLTGDDKKPVRLTATATNYDTALGIRDGIARSARISAADLEDIKLENINGKNFYKVSISFAFNPGKAR